jgi:sulfur-oxidizing protein SoxZ
VTRALINLPASPQRGDVIEIRTLIAHPMESGYRTDAEGRLLPRDIIRRFACRYNGELVFSADLFAAVAANPFIAFCTRATSSGTLVFRWEGDNGFAHTESVAIDVR